MAEQGMTTEKTIALGKELERQGLGGYLAWSPVTRDALVGVSEAAGERFMALGVGVDGRCRLICPALSLNQARRCGVTDMVGLLDGDDPAEAVRAMFSDLGLSGKVAVDDDLPSAHLLSMQGMGLGVEFVSGTKVFGQLARKKDQREIDLLVKTGAIADEAFKALLPQLKVGMTENEIQDALFAEMEKRGGKPSFAIIAAGRNGAEPHHHTDDTVVKEGDVVIMDFGCDVEGYQSDTTRTVSFGEPSDKDADEVYRVVLEAHHAARKVIMAGVEAGAVDAAARGVIDRAGYGKAFFHRVGHGLGRSVHEEPYLVPGSEEILNAGDVCSIEPGIYLEGRFGVRIENIVAVEDGGHLSFNCEPPAGLIRIG